MCSFSLSSQHGNSCLNNNFSLAYNLFNYIPHISVAFIYPLPSAPPRHFVKVIWKIICNIIPLYIFPWFKHGLIHHCAHFVRIPQYFVPLGSHAHCGPAVSWDTRRGCFGGLQNRAHYSTVYFLKPLSKSVYFMAAHVLTCVPRVHSVSLYFTLAYVLLTRATSDTNSHETASYWAGHEILSCDFPPAYVIHSSGIWRRRDGHSNLLLWMTELILS